MRIQIFNTFGRELQDFAPIRSAKVGMYACGPTVYKFAHIGNLRAYIFEDLLRRMFEYAGYEVRHVMNVTDVGHLTDDADEGEDKMLLSAREEGMTVREIADHYSDAFFHDLERLNIERPTVVCRATDHIDDMIDLVRRLERNGFTYSSGGNIYFDIEKFPDYGKMALLDRQELRSGARIEVDANKKNPRDFVLWFTKSKFEHQAMLWDSPWGRGYPGWHLECSAMSMKYLGEHFDLHCGGVDHIPVHHTNEIAQSEAATGKKWVNYWLHSEFLLMNDEKMAKSGEGFITLTDLVESGYDPLDYRYLCLGAHYRSQLRYSTEALDAARAARRSLNERVSRLKRAGASPADSELSGPALSFLEDFREQVFEDLAIPKGLATLWNLLKDPAIDDRDKLGAALSMDRVFGLRLAEIQTNEVAVDDDVRELVRQREAARKAGDYSRADEIRDMLRERGMTLEDTVDGPKIYRKREGE